MTYVAYPVSGAPSLAGLGLGPRLVRRIGPRARRGVFPRVTLPMAGLGAPYCYILPNGSRQCGDTTDAAFMAAARAAGAVLPPGYVATPPIGTTPPIPPNPYGTSSIPAGAVVGASDQTPGTFAEDALYLINGDGTRSWIPDQATLTALGKNASYAIRIPTAQLDAIPLGSSLQSVTTHPYASDIAAQNAATATASAVAAAPAATSAAGTVVSYMEPGAVYNPSTGYYTNPDGTLYAASASSAALPTATAAAGTVVSYMLPGAVYNPSTGYYTNSDGTLYTAATTSAIDLTSPTTWPWYLWAGIAVGGFLLLRRR